MDHKFFAGISRDQETHPNAFQPEDLEGYSYWIQAAIIVFLLILLAMCTCCVCATCRFGWGAFVYGFVRPVKKLCGKVRPRKTTRNSCAFETVSQPTLQCNARSVAGSVYCPRHTAERREQAASVKESVRRFADLPPYTLLEVFHSLKLAPLPERVAEIVADEIDEPEPGFVYLYQRDSDEAARVAGKHMYKIGFTTRTVAERLAEFDDAQLLFSVSSLDARLAEELVHARLAQCRYRRYNTRTAAFEVEWFYGRSDFFAAIMRQTAAVVEANIGDLQAITVQDLER